MRAQKTLLETQIKSSQQAANSLPIYNASFRSCRVCEAGPAQAAEPSNKTRIRDTMNLVVRMAHLPAGRAFQPNMQGPLSTHWPVLADEHGDTGMSVNFPIAVNAKDYGLAGVAT